MLEETNQQQQKQYSKYKEFLTQNKDQKLTSDLRAYELRKENLRILDEAKATFEHAQDYWQNGRGRVKTQEGTRIFDAFAIIEQQKKKTNVIKRNENFTIGSFYEFSSSNPILKKENCQLVPGLDEKKFNTYLTNGYNYFTQDSTCKFLGSAFDKTKQKPTGKFMNKEVLDESEDDKPQSESESDSDDGDMFGESKINFKGVKLNNDKEEFTVKHKQMIDDLDGDIEAENVHNQKFKNEMNYIKGNVMSSIEAVLEGSKEGYMECFPMTEAMEVEYGQKDFKEFKKDKVAKRGKLGEKGEWKQIEKKIKRK